MIRRCDRDIVKGKPCGMPAKWQIALRLWSVGRDHTMKPDAKLLTSMCVCNKHKLDTVAADLLDEETKEKIISAVNPMLPAFTLTEIEWVQLRSPKQVNSNSWANFQVVENPERRWHQCHFDGCDSEAVWTAHVIVKALKRHLFINDEILELTCETTVKVCDKHQTKAAEFLLSDNNRQALYNLLRENNITSIDLSSIRVAFGRWDEAGRHQQQ